MLLECTRVYPQKLLSTPLTLVSFVPPRTFINTNARQMKKPTILRCILVWVLLLLASCRSADSPTPQIKAVDHQPAGAWSSPQRTLTEVRSIAQAEVIYADWATYLKEIPHRLFTGEALSETQAEFPRLRGPQHLLFSENVPRVTLGRYPRDGWSCRS